MRYAYLSFLEKQTENSVCILGLASVPTITTGAKRLKIGQPILAIYSRDDEALAFYVISSDGIPQQIWGKQDYLLDEIFLKDLTPLYVSSLRATEFLISSGYCGISLSEMVQHKEACLSWECQALAANIVSRNDWKACKKEIQKHLDASDLPRDIIKKMSDSIANAACPKKDFLLQAVKVDFLGYPCDSFNLNTKD